MQAKLSPGLGVVILLGVASAFASNHLCARIAFDHGASVATAVSVRATFTALFLFVLMRLQGVPIAIPRELRGRTLLAGLLIAAQSYCLYSAVALIPPALALLVFPDLADDVCAAHLGAGQGAAALGSARAHARLRSSGSRSR